METQNAIETLDYELDSIDTIENSSPKKQGKIARFKQFLFSRNTEKEYIKEQKKEAKLNKQSILSIDESCEKTQKHQRRLNECLDAIETQLDKVDEQNKMLLFYLTTVKENNETLLSQVNHLTKHNDELYEQFKMSRRREKIAKTLAIISSIAAIAFTAWRIIDMILRSGG